MRLSIVSSSNVYFYSLANEMGVDLIHDQLEPFGLGRHTGIDLLGEVTGDLPSQEWKRKKFKKAEQQKWYAGETISLGIGQGYNNFTMLQMATAYSTIASGGLRFKPHLVREIKDSVQHTTQRVVNDALEPLPLKPEHVEVIRNAMHGVTLEGTSAKVFAGAGYTSGGKTGTAQAVGLRSGEKYSSVKTDEHKRDHALYVAFAPVENPTIALAVIVENAGWGSGSAAPIARRVFDYWLLGQYPNAEDMAAVRKGQAMVPIGKPLVAAQVPWPRVGATVVALPPAASATASLASAPVSTAASAPR
jgi:penicillin-binding protein 2